MKVLYLLRHAKSSWDDPDLADRDRPLAPRGKRAVRTVAEHLEREHIRPGLVLCSPARRARETLQPLRRVLPKSTEVRFEAELYAAAATDLLRRLRLVPDQVLSVMLVGHNPGLEDLGVMLARPSAKRDLLAAKFPTGAMVALDLDVGRWHDLGERPGETPGEVTLLFLPRELG